MTKKEWLLLLAGPICMVQFPALLGLMSDSSETVVIGIVFPPELVISS